MSQQAPPASWGNLFQPKQQRSALCWRNEPLPKTKRNTSMLPFGQGRSYGDSCINDGHQLIETRWLNKLIHFDHDRGILSCEAGITLKEILDFIVPRGWFLPVTPGTQYVSVGGAIANDVHGKNHHHYGTFGRHITQFKLLRSTGERLICSPNDNTSLYQATIGGLGLTGFITQATIQCRPIESPFLMVETTKYNGLKEFFQLSHSYATRKDTANSKEYTVSWVDSLAHGGSLGRGHFITANHTEQPDDQDHSPQNGDKATTQHGLLVPFNFPSFCLNSLSVKLFNFTYYHRQRERFQQTVSHYQPFFYPLDGLQHWNRLYGTRGFYQYQCVIPKENQAALTEIMQTIANSGQASFLTVLKEFGDIDSPGMLSFPVSGYTYALDFPNRGEATLQLLETLDKITLAAKGRVYPAKDARMSAQAFTTYFGDQLERFIPHIDPAFSSTFWRRVQP